MCRQSGVPFPLMDPYLLFLDHGVVQVSLPLRDLRFAIQYFPLL